MPSISLFEIIFAIIFISVIVLLLMMRRKRIKEYGAVIYKVKLSWKQRIVNLGPVVTWILLTLLSIVTFREYPYYIAECFLFLIFTFAYYNKSYLEFREYGFWYPRKNLRFSSIKKISLQKDDLSIITKEKDQYKFYVKDCHEANIDDLSNIIFSVD